MCAAHDSERPLLPNVSVDYYADGFEARFDGPRPRQQVLAIGASLALLAVGAGLLAYAGFTSDSLLSFLGTLSAMGGSGLGYAAALGHFAERQPAQTSLEVTAHYVQFRSFDGKYTRIAMADIEAVELVRDHLEISSATHRFSASFASNDPVSVREIANRVLELSESAADLSPGAQQAERRAQVLLARMGSAARSRRE